jgi:hypothetical protein
MMEYYRKSNGSNKKKILSTIFTEKLVLEKGPPSLKLQRMKKSCNPSSLNPYDISSGLVKY